MDEPYELAQAAVGTWRAQWWVDASHHDEDIAMALGHRPSRRGVRRRPAQDARGEDVRGWCAAAQDLSVARNVF
jgi:hypothetical protein